MASWQHLVPLLLGFLSQEVRAVESESIIYQVMHAAPGKSEMGTRVLATGVVQAKGGRGDITADWRALWTMSPEALTLFRKMLTEPEVSALPSLIEGPQASDHVPPLARTTILGSNGPQSIVVESPLVNVVPALAHIHDALNRTRPHAPTSTTWFVYSQANVHPQIVETPDNPLAVPQLKDIALLIVRQPDQTLSPSAFPLGAPMIEIEWFEDGQLIDSRSVWPGGQMRQRAAGGSIDWGQMSVSRLEKLKAAMAQADWSSLPSAED